MRGSTIALMCRHGNTEVSYQYDAYGVVYGRGAAERQIAAIAGRPSTFKRGTDYLYTGKRHDAATGLYDYGFRDYAPRLARFTTVDPIKDGRNWYAYVGADPVNLVDPLGLRDLTDEELALIVEILGTTYYDTEIDLGRIELEERVPTVEELREQVAEFGIDIPFSDDEVTAFIGNRAASLPNDTIYLPPDARDTPEEMDALFIHEVWHQYEYQRNSAEEVFPSLVEEALRYRAYQSDPSVSNPYDYGVFLPIQALAAIPYYEGQANFIEDYAFDYISGFPVAARSSVLERSGLRSEAIGNRRSDVVPSAAKEN